MEDKRNLYALALCAMKLPPGATAHMSAEHVRFGGGRASAIPVGHDVEVFLSAAFGYGESEQEVAERYLKALRIDFPAEQGWACHAVRARFMLDVDELFDRLERGEPFSIGRGEPLVSDEQDVDGVVM